MLSDPDNNIRADRLIIVTFTNDAANQILRKLSRALSKAVSECERSEEGERRKRHLINQQNYLGAAKISTISSFCFDLIRNRADDLGISSDFRIIDETEEKMLLYRVFEEISEKYFAGSDPEKALISELYSYFGWYSGNDTGGKEKYEELASLRSFLLSVPYSGETFIEPLKKEYHKGFDDDFDPFGTKYGGIYADSALSLLGSDNVKDAVCFLYGEWRAALETDTDEFCASIKSTAKKTTEKYFRSSADTLRALKAFVDSPADKNSGAEGWDRMFAAMSFSGDIFRSDLSRKSRLKYIGEIYEAAGAEDYDSEKFCDTAEKLGKRFLRAGGIHPCTASELKEDYRSHYTRLVNICAFLDDTEKRLDEIKREKNCLAFSDAELLTLRLLGKYCGDGRIEKTDAARALSREFDFIMIDEFQDSNDLQDIIFRLLSPGGDSENPGNNIFAVGDIKQSIYYFRHANPQIFHDYLVGSEPYSREGSSTMPRNILLNRNFRSSESVIGFVNCIFEKLMSDRCGGIDYDDSQKLVYSGEVWEKENSAKAACISLPDTEILLTDVWNTPFMTDIPDAAPEDAEQPEAEEEHDGEDTGSDVSEEELKADRLEAAAVALKIRRMLDENSGLHPRDICILCPANADAPFFERELAKLGIRASLENRSKYLESREISTVINILRVIDNPHHNAAMAGSLMSPAFMFTADDMAALSNLRGKRSFYETMLEIEGMTAEQIASCAEENGIPEDPLKSAAEKTAVFLCALRRLRSSAAVMGIEDIIRSIYDVTDLYAIMSMYEDGAIKRANLRLLPEYAAAYEEGAACGTGGIYGFIRYIDSMIPDSIDFGCGSSASESDDAVAVKTIHKSKGLEYPVVFLCRCHKAMPDKQKNIVCTVSGGAAFKEISPGTNIRYSSLPAEMIARSKRSDLTSERMRLLYVALTRAKNKLVISAALELSAAGDTGVYRENAVYSDDIYRTCECDITQCEPDEYLGKFYDSTVSAAVSGDSLEPSALLSMPNNGAMINWIIAALSLTGNIPCFNFEKRPPAAEFPAVRVHAMHIDNEVTELLGSRGAKDTISGTAFMNAAPDEELAAKLRVYKEYDTDEKYAADRAKRDIPAKLSVTEITSETHRNDEYDTAFSDSRFSDRDERAVRIKTVKGGLSASERGTALHAFMQYAALKDIACDDTGECVKRIADEAYRLYLDGSMTEEQADYIAGNKKVRYRIAAFFESSLWKNIYLPASDGDILKEQPFMAKISDIIKPADQLNENGENFENTLDEKLRMYYNNNYNETFVQGIADCIIRTPDGFVLIDYKTNEGRSAEWLRDKYEVQLLLYRRVFELIYELPCGSGKAYIYSFGLDPAVSDGGIVTV